MDSLSNQDRDGARARGIKRRNASPNAIAQMVKSKQWIREDGRRDFHIHTVGSRDAFGSAEARELAKAFEEISQRKSK